MANYIESEAKLESRLLQKLEELGYKNRTSDIKSVEDINKNVKHHLERLNAKELEGKQIDNDDFQKYVIEEIKNKTVFFNAKRFRDKILIQKLSNRNYRLDCFDKNNLENNIFEFSHEIVQDSKLGNRSDVTLFMNGFPIVQIELKRKDVDIVNAFNQIIRYKQQAFDNNIYKITQLFVITNDEYTKYYPNNDIYQTPEYISKKGIFNWTDKENNLSNDLIEFADSFLNINTLFKMITNYMVINETEKKLMVLRPYQYYAVESIIEKIERTSEENNLINDLDQRNELNGFIWHATGSGKTLTSFKVAEVLSKKREIDKVIFLVDRTDLDNQTTAEFKKFLGENEDDLIATENTRILFKQLTDVSTKMIVTTMQKMHKLIRKQDSIDKNMNIIFIVDECHRSQFGDMQQALKKTFVKSRMFGFTGTPIFPKNAKDSMTTDQIFGECLHKYLMKHAIRDQNVLPFMIQYVKGPKQILIPGDDVDVEIDSLDKKGFFKSDKYVNKIVDFIYEKHNKLSGNNKFCSMLVTSSIEMAIIYHDKFKEKYSDFNIATLFTAIDNNETTDDENIESGLSKNIRVELDRIIQEYNKSYDSTNCSIEDTKGYSTNVQMKLKDKSIPIQLIIVVRMLTTGFDSKWINNIYLDRKLDGYNLIQTISRANRIADGKNFANVVSFRTFKKDLDKAICLYNDEKSAEDLYIKDTLEELYIKINEFISQLKQSWPTPKDIKNEFLETKKRDFIVIMKQLNKSWIRAKNFLNFDEEKVDITQNELESYREIQKEIYRSLKKEKNFVSILDSVDFELDEFITDEINNDYIFHTLEKIKNVKDHIEIFDLKIKKLLEKIKQQGHTTKARLIARFVEEWKEKMLNGEIDIGDKTIAEAYIDFKFKIMEEKINEFANTYKIDKALFYEVLTKKKREGKSMEAYSDILVKNLKNKISFMERKELKTLIENFINSIDNEYIFDEIFINDDRGNW